MRCPKCGRFTKSVSNEPTLSQLIFGGFRIKMERRCAECEKKVTKKIQAILRRKK